MHQGPIGKLSSKLKSLTETSMQLASPGQANDFESCLSGLPPPPKINVAFSAWFSHQSFHEPNLIH